MTEHLLQQKKSMWTFWWGNEYDNKTMRLKHHNDSSMKQVHQDHNNKLFKDA